MNGLAGQGFLASICAATTYRWIESPVFSYKSTKTNSDINDWVQVMCHGSSTILVKFCKKFVQEIQLPSNSFIWALPDSYNARCCYLILLYLQIHPSFCIQDTKELGTKTSPKKLKNYRGNEL